MTDAGPNAQCIDQAISILVRCIRSSFPNVRIDERVLKDMVRDALGTKRFTDDLSELFRLPTDQVLEAFIELGIQPSDAIVSHRVRTDSDAEWTCCPEGLDDTFGLSIEAASPSFREALQLSGDFCSQLEKEWKRTVDKIDAQDPFLSYYRSDVDAYAAGYAKTTSKSIREFVNKRFPGDPFKYLITVGIGANEQFWHAPCRIYMENRKTPPFWYIVDNPKGVAKLPTDASPSNTLILEYSRSGKTQEVVKVHEFLADSVTRIVFANAGPLHNLAKSEGASCLVCEFPDDIPGRFGRNLTPMLIVPLDLLNLPYQDYWKKTHACTRQWDLTNPSSPPSAIARHLRATQLVHGANHIYFGTNDDILLGSADEFVQFWNEGVNKQGNDYSVSRYFGLPRDSHLNIEGILGNHKTKTAIFLLRTKGDERFRHRLLRDVPRSGNLEHKALTIADVDYALARANAEHFGQYMPTITIEVKDPTLFDVAVLSQLWTDTVYVYSQLVDLNPGSNPEVRHVRDRADALLVKFGHSRKI